MADPMPLIVSLQKVAINEYRAVIPVGAPFDVVVPIVDASSTVMITIPKGSVKSASFKVMSDENVGIGTLPIPPRNHFGYVVSKSTVCNRTRQVVDAITAAVPGVTDCRNISEIQLTTITRLDLNSKRITSLSGADFAGMLSLTLIDLRNNRLSSLPDGIFKGLTTLTTLHLNVNTVDPLTISVSLERIGENQFKAVVPAGAPFTIILPINVANGEVSSGTNGVTIPQSVSASSIFSITRTEGTRAAVTLDIGTIPALPTTHTGYALAKSGTFPIEVFSRINSAPVFTEGDAATSAIAENTVSDENIGDPIAATDVDNDTLTYSLSGTDADAFAIDSKTGQLKTKAAMDYEVKSTYSVTIMVSDDALTDTISVAIIVTDVNENRLPMFTDGDSTTREVAENTASGENIGEPVAATDTDNDTLTYTLSGTDASSFSIVSTSGQLQTKVALDYELKTSYFVTLTVSDGNGGSDSISVTISIMDIDENRAPVFTDGVSTTRTISENTASGENIGVPVSATDADNDVLTYSLGGTDAAAFAIDTKSGQLKTSSALDYETKVTYSVTITVSDGKLTDAITATINITDVDEVPATTENAETTDSSGSTTKTETTENGATTGTDTTIKTETTPTNNAPEFTEGDNTTRSVSENTGSGVDIGTAVSATDADEDDVLTYTLGGTDTSAFSIDSSSGQLRTYTSLDYETKSSYSVTITVSDGSLTDNITVTINVSDVDETPPNSAPVFADGNSTTRSVAENTGSGVGIGTAVSATDADEDALTYTLGGTDTASFSIDSSSGQLRTYTSLDYETKSSYSVTITVSDGNGGSDSITVTINVSDVDESPTNNAPKFSANSATRTVAENTSSGVDIGPAFSATDADDDTLTYSLGGTDAASFSIDNSSGQLKTSAALDYEVKSSYSISVIASDEKFTDSISVTINITNVNEAPVFSEGANTTRTIAENVHQNINIGKAVSATDPDEDDLTYTLGGTDGDSFSIDKTTGQLKTKASLDYETKNAYTVMITVSDDSLTDTITVTINVTNLDETRSNNPSNNPPVFTDGASTTRSVAENTGSDEKIGTPIAATDVDKNTLTYLLSGTDAAAFSIDNKTGQLKTSAALDHENKATYTVTVTVSDGSSTDMISVTINITDVNDAPVITSTSDTTLSIAENTATGTNIGGPLSATDQDDGDTLNWTLDGTDAASFGIVSTTGQLQTKDVLDYETKKSYSVTITVSDGTLKDTIDITINVTDVDENRAPVFTDGTSTTRSVAENTAAGENIGIPVAATDTDNDTLTYALGGTDAGSFSIVSTSGQLQTSAALDFETQTSYSVTINVSDGKLTDSIAVTINVTDVDENRAPIFTDDTSTTRAIAENTAAGENIGVPVAATDADNDTLTYTLSGTDASSFSIVSTSGQLQTSAALDYETKTSYSVTITVTDGNNGTDVITVTINITDVAENVITPAISERTPQIRDAIIAAAGVASADDVTVAQLAAITRLDFDHIQVDPLKSGDFAGMPALREIIFYHSYFGSYPDGIFDELTELTKLELSGCSLRILYPGLIDNLTKLTWFGVGGNYLTSVPTGFFDNNPKLEWINIQKNEINTLPANLFDNNTLVKTLVLGRNNFSSLPLNIFDNNTKLELLDLRNNELTSLAANIFDNHPALEKLFLQGNKFPSLPANVFDNNTKLVWIYLNDNELTALPENVFDKNTALTNITLYSNDLTTLQSGLFDNHGDLNDIDLSKNSLTSLPANLFANNPRLGWLDLRFNQLSDVSGLEGITATTQIFLTRNPIEDYAPLRRLKAANPNVTINVNLDNNIP